VSIIKFFPNETKLQVSNGIALDSEITCRWSVAIWKKLKC